MRQVHGRCHCGHVAYEALVDDTKVSICHCTDCQVLTGTAYRTTVPCARADLRMLGAEPTLYLKTADSGAVRVQGFCGRCGSQIYARAGGDDFTSYGLRVGPMAERATLVPVKQKWCRSALPWAQDISGLPASDGEGV